jgi:hypothetical protein
MDKAHAMLEEARQWLQDGRLDDATQRYAWLWDNILSLSQGMSGVRGSYMVSEMTRLAAIHPPAKARFAVLRDQAAAKMTDSEHDGLMDWINMNDVLAEPDKTLAWFDKERTSPDFHERHPHMGVVFTMWLQTHGRWADCAFFIDNASDLVEQEYHHWKMIDLMMKRVPSVPSRPDTAKLHAQMFLQKVADIYTALVAANRGPEADAALALARAYTPGPRLVRTVLTTLATGPTVREADLKLLDELPEHPKREQLRKKLQRKIR